MSRGINEHHLSIASLLDISTFFEYGLIGENLMIVVIRIDFLEVAHSGGRVRLLHDFIKLGGVVQWLVMGRHHHLDIVMTIAWRNFNEHVLTIIKALAQSTHLWSRDDYYEYWQTWHLLQQSDFSGSDEFISQKMDKVRLTYDENFLHVRKGDALRTLCFYEMATKSESAVSAVVAFYEQGKFYLSSHLTAFDGDYAVAVQAERDIHHPVLRWMMMTVGGMRSGVIRSLVAMHRVNPARVSINVSEIIEVEHGMVPENIRQAIS